MASEAQGQMALDQTSANGQIYKTIAFANGNANNNPSYNFTGSNNIDIPTSDNWGGSPSVWRANGNGGGTWVDTSMLGASSSATIAPEVVGNTTITRDQATARQITMKRNTNSLGINTNHHITMKKALADTNNDGQKDAFLTIYENLPTGTAAQSAGFQVGDILVFNTPELKNSYGGFTMLTQKYSYKKLNANWLWEDSIDGPIGEPQRNIIDWVTGSLSTQEVGAIQTSIYPNPTTDKVMVKLLDAKGVKEYRVYAVDGKLVLSGKALSAKDAIDISGLSAGMYVLQLDIDGKITTHKLIKK